MSVFSQVTRVTFKHIWDVNIVSKAVSLLKYIIVDSLLNFCIDTYLDMYTKCCNISKIED